MTKDTHTDPAPTEIVPRASFWMREENRRVVRIIAMFYVVMALVLAVVNVMMAMLRQG